MSQQDPLASSPAGRSPEAPNTEPAVAPTAAAARSRVERRAGGARPRVVLLLVAVLAASGLLWKGLPFVRHFLSHVETDDAFVTGDATTVGSRISEVVKEVFVQNHDYVERGTVLVSLDREMLKVQVEQKRAQLKQQMLELDQLVKTLETNRAAVDEARDRGAMAIAGLQEAIKGLEAKQDQVRSRVAGLRAAAATLRAAREDLALAQKEFNRVDRLVAKQSATHAELDQRRTVLIRNRESVKAAEEQVQQVRAQLALPVKYADPEEVPAAIEQTDTEVRRAVATGQQILAQLGVRAARNLDPATFRQAVTALLAQPEGWIDRIPSVRVAQGEVDRTLAALGGESFDPTRPYAHPSVMRLQKELDEAELKLSYTEIRAPVSGYVNRKSVNPGDHVQAGQALMAIQPLENVYVIANFKETQLSDIVIGQPVEIVVDAYPAHALRGRVTGFAAATGAASSLLPPENATGNFVKVVQRLPVRIDLEEPAPRQTPLFVGMSVVPEVDLNGVPTGPDAGKRLRSSQAVRAAMASADSDTAEAKR